MAIDERHSEGEPKPEVILLDVPVPPGLAGVFGYRGHARFVSFHWEPNGDDVWFDDGRCSGAGDGRGFLAYLRHRHVSSHLEPYNLGGSDVEADYAFVIDTDHDLAGVMPVAAVRTFLKRHLSLLPLITPEQIEQARRAVDEGVAQGWQEVRVDPDAVLRIMEERRQALATMLSYLERWPHV